MESKITMLPLPDNVQAQTGIHNISQRGNRVIITYCNGEYEETTVSHDITEWDGKHGSGYDIYALIRFLKTKLLNECSQRKH